MIWGYPLYGDDPEKIRRRQVDETWELGASRTTLQLRFEELRHIQNGWYNTTSGTIFTLPDFGLGRTPHMEVRADKAAGEGPIDMKEVEKARKVINYVDQGQGCGVATLLGAKNGVFSFQYHGPIEHLMQIQNLVNIGLSRVYPGSRAEFVTEKWKPDRFLAPSGRGRMASPFSSVRRQLHWKYNYTWAVEGEMDNDGRPAPDPLGTAIEPQAI
ncbi:unnamed protein product [Vitrella brassicaformis CCMP3155]|uniref:Uncharacterized protein n=2 Tax=Vitrella brassicaformis TaxID=1169539 RepID=A0A0G4EPA5_VITBC|nr:unnamed protein product [Vitrella brassicaformis CCMP3155]|eukprot:CEL99259.1 unnamed protein product [Vitrella brassicaformis CCMP3155]